MTDKVPTNEDKIRNPCLYSELVSPSQPGSTRHARKETSFFPLSRLLHTHCTPFASIAKPSYSCHYHRLFLLVFGAFLVCGRLLSLWLISHPMFGHGNIQAPNSEGWDFDRGKKKRGDSTKKMLFIHFFFISLFL